MNELMYTELIVRPSTVEKETCSYNVTAYRHHIENLNRYFEVFKVVFDYTVDLENGEVCYTTSYLPENFINELRKCFRSDLRIDYVCKYKDVFEVSSPVIPDPVRRA